MLSIVLLLTIGGAQTQHSVDSFSYDDRARVLSYWENNSGRVVTGIGPVSLTGQRLVIRTDKIFASRFD